MSRPAKGMPTKYEIENQRQHNSHSAECSCLVCEYRRKHRREYGCEPRFAPAIDAPTPEFKFFPAKDINAARLIWTDSNRKDL